MGFLEPPVLVCDAFVFPILAGASLPNEAVIVGTRDTLTIGRPFHCPTKFTLASGINRDAPLPSPYKKENFVNSTGMRFV